MSQSPWQQHVFGFQVSKDVTVSSRSQSVRSPSDGLTENERLELAERYRRGAGAPVTAADGVAIERFRARRRAR